MTSSDMHEHGSSFAEMFQAHMNTHPEKRLWLALFKDQMRCLGIQDDARSRKGLTLEDWNDTKGWINLVGDEVGQFDWVCSILGLDSTSVRPKIKTKACPKCRLTYWNHFDRCE